MKPGSLVIVSCLSSLISLSQGTDDRRFFPDAVGNTWRWHSYATGNDVDVQLTRDSVDSEENHHLFYNEGTSPRYMIDTNDDVYQYVGTQGNRYLWFRLSAEDGDTFYTVNNIYRVEVAKWPSIMFGDSTVIMQFTWYISPSQVSFAIQQLSLNFGLTYTVSDISPAPSVVTGCVIDGTEYGTLVSVAYEPPIPLGAFLYQNYPNPFNAQTEIGFQITDYGWVVLQIVDLLGQEVATIVNENLSPGSYSRQWDAAGVPSGVYYYRLSTNGFVQTRKLVLLR